MSEHMQMMSSGEIHSLTLLIGERAVQLRDSTKALFPSAPEKRILQDIPSYRAKLAFPDLGQDNLDKVAHLFYYVTDLDIALHYGWIYDIEQLIKLLDDLKDSLVSLKITSQCTNTEFTEVQRKMLRYSVFCLVNKLNELTELRSLTLVFHNLLAYPINLQVLGQLKEFNFSSPDYLEKLFGPLRKYVNRASPVRIDIRNCVTSVEKLNQLEHISHKFDRLDVSHELVCQCQLISVTDLFISLSSLSISIGYQLSFNKLALTLAKLINLTNLALIVNFRAPSFIKWDEGVAMHSISRLTAIKCLTLEVITKKTDDLRSINFDWLFPSLEMMIFVDHQKVLLYEELMGTNKPEILHLASKGRTKSQYMRQLSDMLRTVPHPEENFRIRGRPIRKEDVRHELYSLNREINAFPRQTQPSDEPDLIIEQQHYDDPERREQFIRNYLRSLMQISTLESVKVYERIQDSSEITLLHSHSF